MKKVMVAMSGGVDSSVALLLLKEKYELMGVTLRLFDNEDVGIERTRTCCSLSDVEDARAVANKFDVPHFVFNFKDRFKTQVIDRFNKSYFNGETPNPCIDCNTYIKFREMLDRAVSLECDYIATGHYARVCYDENSGRYLLKKAIDVANGTLANDKDQSYVLYALKQEQLSKTLFPLGDMRKSDVRKVAEENGLVNADKPDSQDICFVPDGDYASFIQRYTGKTVPNGDFVDLENNVIGKHNGVIHYTIGQRKGLGKGFGKPMYVVDKDAEANRVVLGENSDLFRKTLTARELNWISIPSLEQPMRLKAKTRYKQEEQPCIISPLANGEVFVEFDEPMRAITSGQRVVFYDKDTVVGGGVIC